MTPEPETQETVEPGVLKLGGAVIVLLGLLIVLLGWRLVLLLWLSTIALAVAFTLFMIVWYKLKTGKWIWR